MIVEKGTLGSEEWYGAKFTGFYFYLLCIRHGNEKGGNREVQMSIGKSKTHKNPPSLAKGPVKEQLCKTEDF